jgi:hypothetical protein
MEISEDRLRVISEFSKWCHAGRDGECVWKKCPQNRDNEPRKSGRHCPIDFNSDIEGD